MAKIKTKDAIKGTIRQLDRAGIAADRMKRAYISTKEKAETSTHASEANMEEYASDRIEAGVQNATHETIHLGEKAGKKAMETVREDIPQAKQAVQQFRAKRAEQRESRIKTKEYEAARGETQSDPVATEQRTGNSRPVTEKPNSATRTAQGEERSVAQGRQRVEKNVRVKHQEATIRQRQGTMRQPMQQTGKTVSEQPGRTIRQSARSAEKKTVKTTQRAVAKTTKKGVKTAEHTAKTAIKTSKEAAKTAERAARASAKAAQKAAQAAKVAAKATAEGIKVAVKATVAAVKAIIAAVKSLIAAIAAGGWVAVIVVVIICLIGLVLGSVFGIFFSGEDSGTGMSMRTVVQEINTDYDTQLQAAKDAVSYDSLEMSGSRAVWPDVLAVYAVKVNTDPDEPLEVATMDDTKKQLLKDIFWEMNEISSRTETSSHTEMEETVDDDGNIVETEITVTETTLYITVSHKTVDEMAALYGFTEEQKQYLADLLSDENNSLWSAVLYGISYSDDQIVVVALSQIGNLGGQPYWSWYGFGSRVEWCACFVSWCANECGYIDNGIIPKYAGCIGGSQWFKDRGQWADNSVEPVPGMIIFFDWDDDGGQDGEADHTGIVEKVEGGRVYTVEGNSGDSVRINSYPVGYYEIYGYGVPQY